jgi:hypothetical protein
MDKEVRPMTTEEKEKYEKMQAAQAAQCGQAIGGDTCCEETGNKYQTRPYTLREEAEVRLRNHREHAKNASLAAEFFRDNPAFDEFIRLVRSGAIQL